MPPSTRRSDCPQYGTSVASKAFTRSPASRQLARKAPAKQQSSTVDVPEDEVQAGQNRDDVGHVDAAEHPRRDRDVVEARRADLDPEGAEVTLAHDVVTHLTERVLGRHPGLAFRDLDD